MAQKQAETLDGLKRLRARIQKKKESYRARILICMTGCRALGAGPVGETFRINAPGRISLQGIVADGARGAQAFFHIARFDQITVLACPYACIAIGLQLHAHLQLICLSRVLLLDAAHLIGEASQVLNVMAVFMRHDVIAREVSFRAALFGFRR